MRVKPRFKIIEIDGVKFRFEPIDDKVKLSIFGDDVLGLDLTMTKEQCTTMGDVMKVLGSGADT
jgi:hypothetical protein